MKKLRALFLGVSALALTSAPALAQEFEKVTEVEADVVRPIPLLLLAYALIFVILGAYSLGLWRTVRKAKQTLASLEGQAKALATRTSPR